jgi:hypothetical protein
MRKKRLSAPERHAIEAALKGEPFPGLVSSLSQGTCWFCRASGASLSLAISRRKARSCRSRSRKTERVGQPPSRSRQMANERRRCLSLQTGPRTIVFGSSRGRERRDAKQLVSMTSTQLLSQRTLALLDDLETAARCAKLKNKPIILPRRYKSPGLYQVL